MFTRNQNRHRYTVGRKPAKSKIKNSEDRRVLKSSEEAQCSHKAEREALMGTWNDQTWRGPPCSPTLGGRHYCNTNTHTHKDMAKYRNTQTHHMMRYEKDPTCEWKEYCSRIKNDIPKSQTCKYKNTDTQIHKGLFKDIKNDIPISQTHKYFWREYRQRISSEHTCEKRGTLGTLSPPIFWM